MNILMFGPNGSGKGTQGALIKKAFGLAHIESGAIFREHGFRKSATTASLYLLFPSTP